MHAPRTTHLHAVKWIIRYLQGTLDLGLFLYSSSSPTVVIAYSDADWAGCPNTRRSSTTVFLGKNIISWRLKKQPTASKSSIEAEYRAVAYTTAELFGSSNFLLTLAIFFIVLWSSIVIMSLQLISLPVHHDLNKHIDVDYHFVREMVAKGGLIVRQCSYSVSCCWYLY